MTGSAAGGAVFRLEAIGRGSTSVVYRALEASTFCLVALKVASGGGDVAQEHSSVLNEIAILTHLGRSACFEAAAAAKCFLSYAVCGPESIECELATLGSIENCLGRVDFPLEWLVEIASALSAALGAIHGANVLHRDVKPGNVLLARDGTTKLADFSLAVVGDEADTYVGTFQYLSPERLRGQPYGRPADVWALAMTLLTLALAGAPANRFDNENDFWPALELYESPDLYDRILRHAADQGIQMTHHHSAFFRAYVERRLDADPARRPTTTGRKHLKKNTTKKEASTPRRRKKDCGTPPPPPPPERGGESRGSTPPPKGEEDDDDEWIRSQERWTPAERRAHVAPLVPPMAERLRDLDHVLDTVQADLHHRKHTNGKDARQQTPLAMGIDRQRNLAAAFDLPLSTVQTALRARPASFRIQRNFAPCLCS